MLHDLSISYGFIVTVLCCTVTATTELYTYTHTLSLPDALPIWSCLPSLWLVRCEEAPSPAWSSDQSSPRRRDPQRREPVQRLPQAIQRHGWNGVREQHDSHA